jgi:DNA-binding IclR family transcriptional regulator/enamine deaminase RidA (YjgF/YER057c/UK114 family)
MPTPKNNSVIKAFDILRLLAEESRPLSQQQVALALDINLSTTNRFLLTLEEIGAVARMPGNLYQLGMLISELGQNAGRGQILTERAQLHVENLAEELGETVSLTLFSRGGPRKAIWHEPNRQLVCRERGDFGPNFYATSVGKLHLTDLSASALEEQLAMLTLTPITRHTVATIEGLRAQVRRARSDGYAVNVEETELGLMDFSVPITTASGEMLGALTVSAPLSRLAADDLAPAVLKASKVAEAIVDRVFIKSYTVPGKPRPKGSFPHVKRVENFVFVSGTSSRRPDETFGGVSVFPDGSLVHDTFEQTRETMANITDILGNLLLKPDHIVSLEAFLTNMDDRDEFLSAIAPSFLTRAPAMTITKAKALPHPHQAVMIKAVARLPNVAATAKQ